MLNNPKVSLLQFFQIKIPSAMTTDGIFYCGWRVQPVGSIKSVTTVSKP